MTNIFILLPIVGIFLFVVGYFQLITLLKPSRRLPVLMYHKIGENTLDDLSVSPQNLEKQFAHIAKNGYECTFFRDLKTAENRQIIITFDDGYHDNYLHLPRLLKKYGLKATVFIPTKFIQNGYGDERMMSFPELRDLDKDLIEIGLHSHSHENFKNISPEAAKLDLLENMQVLQEQQIPFTKIFAYPYGKYPKNKEAKSVFFEMLQDMGIQYGVRIGNRINILPLKNNFEICRIDIKGTDSFFKFKLKLLLGKSKFF